MSDGMTISTERPGGGRSLPASRWLRIVAVNTAAAVMVALLLTVLGSPLPFGAKLLASLLYANAIGTPAALLLRPLTRRFAGRRALLWPLLLATLLTLAVVGSLLAGLIVMALGLVPSERLWAAWAFALQIAVVVTLAIGVSMVLYETTRAKLGQTTLELRTKELERERAEKLALEARLASLESRLHPHFLFNALSAITALVPEDPERAEQLLEQFADLLRASLDTAVRHTVPLGDELALVRAYLEIEQARLGERLRYALDIPAECQALEVPPFSLHILVENSIKHVAARRREGVEITIDGRLGDGRLVLSVRDDGPGFTLARVPAGHGLDNLRCRLATLYGTRAGLEAVRDAGGARVVMSLPARPVGVDRP